VSMEDMALAVLDEIERPAHRRALLTVASLR
jgi:putative NADH-flavin reductase